MSLEKKDRPMLSFVADENIPYVRAAFQALGETLVVPAHEITPELVRDVDGLLVRSVTRVDESLLAKSRVRFVGTATIGIDHVDTAYLERRGIAFASAPGSNARSVAEWFTAALLHFAIDTNQSIEGKTIGIIGVGNVGSRVERIATALGARVLRNDPPRARLEGPGLFVSLEELLSESDIVTLHTPLTREGVDATWHLANSSFFSKLRPGTWFFNASRGAVVEEEALREAIRTGRIARTALDVWEHEPQISSETLALVSLGTPHIAGYSFDGKVAGTRMIREAACRFFGIQAEWEPHLPPPPLAHLEILVKGRSDEEVLHEAVSAVYSIQKDDQALRKALDLPSEEIASYFTRLRKEYPERREFPAVTLHLPDASERLQHKFKGIGFQIVDSSSRKGYTMKGNLEGPLSPAGEGISVSDTPQKEKEEKEEEKESEKERESIETKSEEGAESGEEEKEKEGGEAEEEEESMLPLASVVEAILFASPRPLTLKEIAKCIGRRTRPEAVREAIQSLNQSYEATARAFEIVETAERFQLLSRPEFAPYLQRLLGKSPEKEKKLTPAALDTLSIIAYKQPITRAEIEEIRGVSCSQVLRFLLERGTIRIVGKKMDVLGHPLLYGTTEAFLEEFGLASLKDLPRVQELRRAIDASTS